MKVIALIRGDLSDSLQGKPASDGGLSGQKSAESHSSGKVFFREGPNVRTYEKSRSSRAMPGPQKTLENKGYSGKVGMESQGARKVHSIAPARADGNIPGQSNNILFNQILSRENLNAALKRVMNNKGAAGVDKVTYREFKEYLVLNWANIKKELVEETYQPSPVRRVEIPKSYGGKRNLGIPTLLDRLIQQAVGQILMPIYEKKFSNSSYGFRPCRSAHHAVKQAREYIESGYKWVVDIDLKSSLTELNMIF